MLGYSRRIFVRASLSQRQDDWREGLAGAFRHFGGVPQTLLIDNAGALVVGPRSRSRHRSHSTRRSPRSAATGASTSRACRPYRARTKGKTESGVGYVKRNALGRAERSRVFAALEAHLARWMVDADQRVHGTTHERPR